jgi:hypothetical protein
MYWSFSRSLALPLKQTICAMPTIILQLVIARLDDIGYFVQDAAFVTFYTDLTATVETENSDVRGSMNYSKFGPWIKFFNECEDSKGRGFALAGLIIFKYLDDCAKLLFDCVGFRDRKKQ